MLRRLLTQGRLAFEDQLVRVALLIGGLPYVCLFVLVYQHSMSVHAKITLLTTVLVVILYSIFLIRHKVVNRLRTSTNLMEAMVNGDYSMRANSCDESGVLSEFNLLVNSLAETINEQRLVSKEQQILLHKVIVQIDVAILAVDEDNHISLMNPAAEKLFSQKFTELEGAPIHQLGLQKVVEADIRRVVEFELATIKKKVYLHTDEFFEKGIQRKLIFITDVQKMLHEEERRAWQKLVRVLSHEINNSLAPITSISDSLSQLVHSSEKLADIKEDLTDGLAVITERSQSLEYFIERYQQLSHLPMPEKSVVNLAQLLESVAALYEDERVTLCDLTADEIYVDNSQLQQVLVNLIKNALEAMKDKPEKTVEIRCSQDRQSFIIEVLDHGTGIFNSDNLFVPYYTTKAQGSGIGLALSRQIIANHGGELSLSNRKDTEGAIARISLPKAAA